MKHFILLFFLLALCVTSFDAHAFDGDRRGFVLGLGLGAGNAGLDVEGIRGSETGLGLDFKLGGGVSQQFWLYYHGRGLSYSIDSIGTDLTIVQTFNGVGLTYFVKPSAPSLFFSGGLGYGFIRLSSGFRTLGDESGPGAQIAGGYEFRPGLALEFSYMVADLSSEGDAAIDNLMFTLNWTWY